jgi:hypothetical protein
MTVSDLRAARPPAACLSIDELKEIWKSGGLKLLANA